MSETITQAQYRAFQQAYDFFNAELFSGTLPHVLVTLQRHAKARGYFSPERFTGRSQQTTAHELAMNPDTFTGRTDEEILSTLAHEMAHVWQQTHGKPPTRCYHDRQWAAKMKEIGLQPSTTGQPGGKETGQSVTHYIIPGGAYAKAYARLAATGLKLDWESMPAGKDAKAKKASKTKFTCHLRTSFSARELNSSFAASFTTRSTMFNGRRSILRQNSMRPGSRSTRSSARRQPIAALA